MKPSRMGAVAGVIVLGAMSFGAVAHASSPVATTVAAHRNCTPSGSTAVGTWLMVITPKVPHAKPFPSLVAVALGGTMSDSIPQAPKSPAFGPNQPNGATSAVGAWAWSGNRMVFTFERFLTKDGVYTIKQRVSGQAFLIKNCSVQVGSATVTFETRSGQPLGRPVTVLTQGVRLAP